MNKYFAPIIFLLLTATLFSVAKPRRSHSRHRANTESARIILHGDSVSADSLLQFAKSFIGTRYRSRCSDPSVGFDCSGFVSYVFKNFNFAVPRSSGDFINFGQKVSLEDARPGDIILFTGTHKHSRRIGHVGIVYCNDNDEFKFIHSTSGKEHGVTITAMDNTYKRRYVQVIRLL